ncbi:hypothetical protein NKI34_10305 [Mesorhizobium sp. M0700]|uniref:hypothetical protein n=1 Tax=Mesorhizobium sp. M0700 TaxID=2956988 RepID=UPI0033368707
MPSLGESYEMIGRILAKLILGGLRSQEIGVASVIDADKVSRHDLHHFVDVVKWLQNEGLITRGHALLSGDYLGVQLTSRGIAAVEQGQFSASTGKSIRETVESKSEGGLTSDTYGKIGSFVGGLLGGFTQAGS